METTVRILNRLTSLLAVAVIVLLTHFEAQAQNLSFQNPLQLTMAGGAGTATASVTVSILQSGSLTGTPTTSLTVNSTNQPWLCASASGSNTLIVTVGTGCATYTTSSQLAPGVYNGNVFFT